MSLVERTAGEENISSPSISENKEKMSMFTKVKFGFFGIVGITILTTIITSIYSSSHTIIIDNPTDENIVVQIDTNTELTIPAQSSIHSDISKGTHSVALNGKIIGTFEKESFDMNPLLNPTLSEYVVEHIFYGDEKYYDSNMPMFDSVFFGETLSGPFEVKTGLYIKKDWDYGMDIESPDQVSLGKNQNFSIKQQIYRPKDFIAMYMQYYTESEGENDEVNSDEIVNEILTGSIQN